AGLGNDEGGTTGTTGDHVGDGDLGRSAHHRNAVEAGAGERGRLGRAIEEQRGAVGESVVMLTGASLVPRTISVPLATLSSLPSCNETPGSRVSWAAGALPLSTE